jgi:dolichyl-phosphate-mannose--protein O-mannosyl transferase
VTATLEGTAQEAEPEEGPPDPAAPTEPPEREHPVPAALLPWRDPHPWIGRLGLLVITIAAVFTRFWALGFPPGRNSIPNHGFNFDEVYYATEAQEMLRYGYEDNRGYLFIVHPPLGKWLIAGSEWFQGVLDGQHSSDAYLTNSLGWRIMPAIFGCLSIIMITRIVRRMMRSNMFGFIAGVLMLCEGLSLVLARTAILDIFLETFVLAGFGALVLDRDRMRARLARLIADGADLSAGVPSLGPRPWRLAGGVLLGLACAVKWSGAFFLFAFVLLTLVWDRAALKTAGVRRPTRSWLRRSVLPATGSLFVAPIGAYLLTYLGWFTGENGYNRHWADTHGPSTHLHIFGLKVPFSWAWVPGPIRSLGDDTYRAFQFHESLTAPHPYGSNPWSWLVMGRPVDFYYEAPAGGCGAPSCSQQVLLIGTPLLWWAFVPMLLWLAWHWFTTRDWRAASVWVAFLAGWLIWVYYWVSDHRTMFLFYMAPLIPFLIIGLTLALGVMLGPGGLRARFPLPADRPAGLRRLARLRLALVPVYVLLMIAAAHSQAESKARRLELAVLGAAVIVSIGWDVFDRWRATPAGEVRRFWGSLGVCTFLGLVVADFAWMWPIFTGGMLTYSQWHVHMWLPSWV